MAVHPRWLPHPVPRELTRSPRTRYERTEEQDAAAGGREARLVTVAPGSTATGSVALERFPNTRRLYAYLRFKRGGKNFRIYVGDVSADTRAEALRRAWALVQDKGLRDRAGFATADRRGD